MEQGLTSEQEALMRSVIEEWVKVPFDTSPVDREKAEAAINLTYECVEEERPKKIIWFDNPLDAVIWMIDNLDCLEHPKYFSAVSFNLYWDDIVYDVNCKIDVNIRSQFEHNFNKIIHYKHLNWLSQSFLADFLGCYLRNCLFDFRGQRQFSLKHGKFEDIEDYEAHQNHEIYYLAATSFYQQIDIDCSKFIGYWDAAKYCGLWWAFYDVAVVTPKPSVIRLDNEYKLHAEDEPAIVYKGFELYAHHGKYIDSKIIK